MNGVNQELLRGVATATRANLEEKAWPYSHIRSAHPGAPLSRGQCHDSIWHLLKGLRAEGLDGMDVPIQRHFGHLAITATHNTALIYPHQWLTVAQFTLDITGDQNGYEPAKVVCAGPEELEALGLVYEPYNTYNTWLEGDRWDEIQVTFRATTQPALM